MQSCNRKTGLGRVSIAVGRDKDAKCRWRVRQSKDLSVVMTVDKEAECNGTEGGMNHRREMRSKSSQVDVVGAWPRRGGAIAQ
ncbi:hypothetical protein GYH30_031730 [Glycine max]|nr:hypothetical protein GYH30_031730 [Glycine max]